MKPGRMLAYAYVLMLLVITMLPAFSAEGYSLLRHTTSQLGAQNTPNAWVMNVVFVALGVAVVLESWWGLGGYRFQQIVLIIFGLSLILTAVFRHAPITEGVAFSASADNWHSVFATLVGFSFTLFAVSAAFIPAAMKRRLLALFMAAVATLLSLLIFQVPQLAGIWQRTMFVVSFAWLIEFFWSSCGQT